jgi:hypothetical protein
MDRAKCQPFTLGQLPRDNCCLAIASRQLLLGNLFGVKDRQDSMPVSESFSWLRCCYICQCSLCASVLLFVSLLLCVPVLLFVSVLFYLRHPGRTKGPGCYRGNADVTAATCGNNAD